MHDKYDDAPSSDEEEKSSDGTVDLPARFDEHGNRKSDDALSDKIHDMLAGRGVAGKFFQSLTGGLTGGGNGSDGGGDDHDDNNDGRTGRRRSRR